MLIRGEAAKSPHLQVALCEGTPLSVRKWGISQREREREGENKTLWPQFEQSRPSLTE